MLDYTLWWVYCECKCVWIGSFPFASLYVSALLAGNTFNSSWRINKPWNKCKKGKEHLNEISFSCRVTKDCKEQNYIYVHGFFFLRDLRKYKLSGWGFFLSVKQRQHEFGYFHLISLRTQLYVYIRRFVNVHYGRVHTRSDESHFFFGLCVGRFVIKFSL